MLSVRRRRRVTGYAYFKDIARGRLSGGDSAGFLKLVSRADDPSRHVVIGVQIIGEPGVCGGELNAASRVFAFFLEGVFPCTTYFLRVIAISTPCARETGTAGIMVVDFFGGNGAASFLAGTAPCYDSVVCRPLTRSSGLVC